MKQTLFRSGLKTAFFEDPMSSLELAQSFLYGSVVAMSTESNPLPSAART